MDRRDTLKSLLITSIGGGLVLQSCETEKPEVSETSSVVDSPTGTYGRTPKEKERDEHLNNQTLFSEHELSTIAVLCDIILPATDSAASASQLKVPEFIEFIAKDIPTHQLPLRGGIMWIDSYSNRTYKKVFISCNQEEQISIIEKIAWPDQVEPGFEPGVKFFTLMRNLTLIGYYTTKEGIEELGYKGNSPTIWNGVPEDIMKEHGFEYESDWIPKFVDQSKRENIAEWDEEGNLLT